MHKLLFFFLGISIIYAQGTTKSKETVQKISKPTPTTQERSFKDSIVALAYRGADLGYLANKYYGNKAYRQVLSAYNDFADKHSIDKKYDTIRIPQLSNLSKNSDYIKLNTADNELDKVIKARNLYLKQERTLWELPVDPKNRDFRSVSHAQKIELLAASKLMYECVLGLEQLENSPKKTIGQFRQVAKNLENIANGEIDENGYALDMVHQRLAHGFGNLINWAKENEK